MQNIQIKNNTELLNGFLAVCDAVAETLGAEGKFAVMEDTDPYAPPIITKDGISVARKIHFPNKFNNIGAFLAKQVAAKTLTKSGDSTTTSLVLASAFVRNTKYYNKAVERGLDFAHKEFLSIISKLTQKVDRDSLVKIATISANNDEKIGNIIIEAYDEVGYDGIIEVTQNSDSALTTKSVHKGYKVDKGWATPWMINNEKMATWEAEDVLIVCAETYESDDTIKRFIEVNKKQPILLIMERFTEQFRDELESLFKRGAINLCLVQAPDFDIKRRAFLEDISLYTGAEVYVKGQSPSIVSGKADRVVVGESSTSIIQETPKEAVDLRIEELKQQMEAVTDKSFIKRRIQKLEGVSCVISVGGFTDTESKEKFDRVEDAVFAVKSSLANGWISGGGSTLVYISNQMKAKFSNKDEQYGYEIFKKTLQQPFLQILKNANRKQKEGFFSGGLDYLSPTTTQYGVGYNAKTDVISNLIEDGVLDSTKSIKVALENALSVSQRLLNVGVIVTYSN